MTPPAAHRVTTAHLQALYPFVAEGGLGDRGVYIGRNLFGGGFVYDPWELYRTGAVTNPNMLVLGQIGRGKSSFVKAFLWRQQVFGRQAWVVDPKGEYGPFAHASGTRSVRVAPGGAVRLNPLEPAAPMRDGHDLTRRRGELVCSLAAASLGRTLLPHERTAVELAVASISGRAAAPTIPAVVKALLRPATSSASAVCSDAGSLAADGRAVALELRRLVEGDLAGMFDGPTCPGLKMDGRLVVLDLSALYASPALAILMTCAAAWLQAVLNRDDGVRRLVVVDEASNTPQTTTRLRPCTPLSPVSSRLLSSTHELPPTRPTSASASTARSSSPPPAPSTYGLVPRSRSSVTTRSPPPIRPSTASATRPSWLRCGAPRPGRSSGSSSTSSPG